MEAARIELRLSRFVVVSLVFMALARLAFALVDLHHTGFFWDLDVYSRAVEVRQAGGDPYSTSERLLFVYHPLILDAMSVFGDKLTRLLTFLYLIVVFTFARAAATQGFTWEVFLALGYGAMGLDAAATGNLTTFMHLALLTLILGGLTQPSARHGFILLVALFSAVKPYLAIYALLPFVLSHARGESWRPLLGWAVGAFSTVALALLSYSLFDPDRVALFLAALNAQTLVKGDLGFGFGYFINLALDGNWVGAVIGHMVIAIAISWVTIRRFHGRIADPVTYALLLYLLLSLFNPRLKLYDVAPMLFALFVLFRVGAPTRWGEWLFLGAYAMSPLYLLFAWYQVQIPVLNDPAYGFHVTLIGVFLMAYHGLSRTRGDGLRAT
ncbi:MAG: hypothetical protein H6980_11120 [Gammaproteobacteria bacterium]|nr:hypothetical protein [Gammaproteobacteria bacterium]